MSSPFDAIARIGVVPVIAIEDAKDAVPLADALIAGGLPVAEITFRTPAAADVLARLAADRPELIVGAGTVLDLASLEACRRCGAKFGLALNDLVARGEVKAPIVIGRDHLDCGSVASPYRETESMKDGSDAVADWALLNALVNTASGASWVSIHNGGGVGIGYSQHAGQVLCADGTPEMAARIERVLTNDPGMGVVRHVDAGYPEAISFAQKSHVKIPML